jgi:hypothetical protein
MTLYGFYSAQAAKSCGSLIYTTPDGTEVEVTPTTSAIYTTPDGREVEVTLVAPSTKPDYRWPDTVSVGPVVNFVRKVNA